MPVGSSSVSGADGLGPPGEGAASQHCQRGRQSEPLDPSVLGGTFPLIACSSFILAMLWPKHHLT